MPGRSGERSGVEGSGAEDYGAEGSGRERSREESAGLDGETRSALQGLARLAVRAALEGEAAPQVPAAAALQAPGEAFVSLHTRGGELRGCVGLLRSDSPLGGTVARMAAAAATEDGRF